MIVSSYRKIIDAQFQGSVKRKVSHFAMPKKRKYEQMKSPNQMLLSLSSLETVPLKKKGRRCENCCLLLFPKCTFFEVLKSKIFQGWWDFNRWIIITDKQNVAYCWFRVWFALFSDTRKMSSKLKILVLLSKFLLQLNQA